MDTNSIPAASRFLSQIKNPEDLLKVLWRRKLWLLLSLLIGGLGAVVFLKVVPPAYQASTMILVESQKMPTDYIRPTVTTALNERLRTIEQEIKNRSNLERIVVDMGLYADLRQRRGMDHAVRLVRRNLRLRVMGNQIFEIHFSGGDPEKVASTANRVADLFIEENLRRRASEAENTSTFLADELESTKKLLEGQELKVSEYRIRYAGQLPEDRPANMQAIAQLETQLEIAQEEMRGTELQILMIKQEAPPAAQMTDFGAVDQPTSRLEDARRELQRLSAQYTDLHPDVIRLRREIDMLEAQDKAMPTGAHPGSQSTAPSSDYEADLRVDSLEAQLDRLKDRRDKNLSELTIYRRRLDAIPRVEQELVQLTRDYENLQNSYQSLLSKKIEARLSENLERKRQSEQFRVLEAAVAPSKPYAPDKFKSVVLGLVTGVAFGLGLILLREGTDQTYKDPDLLRRAFPNVRFLGSIHKMRDSEIGEEMDRSTQKTA